MRVLYIDIDSLRADHLGCYGYHRRTSPNIDRIAERGARFTNYYASDVPCLPSRTALFSARLGIHTGVINHGGLEADMRPQGARRGFANHAPTYRSFITALRRTGMRTALISPFPTRHAAWHVLDGFHEWVDTGKNGLERADEVTPTAVRWIAENAKQDDWYLHINFWDPHTPYRTPMDYGNPFEGDPAPSWLNEETIAAHRASFGPHSAQELAGWGPCDPEKFPRLPREIASVADFKQWIDGYDTGIRYADDHVGQILDALGAQGVLDETLIIITADHGENQGELNVYGDHQTADQPTCRLPLVVAGPGVVQGHVDDDFHYQIDLGPTLVDLVDGRPGSRWDGESFLPALTDGTSAGRPYLVLSQGAWSCQRSVRFGPWLYIRTYHDGLKDFPDHMLFDIEVDPHETTNLAAGRPEVVAEAAQRLEAWVADQMACGDDATDPMWHVIHEGGPWHTRGWLDKYLERLRETGRREVADRLAARHGRG